MTSLIDVIFLLLLFFMLTSTFTRFSEVELTAAGSGTPPQAPTEAPLFLRLGAETAQRCCYLCLRGALFASEAGNLYKRRQGRHASFTVARRQVKSVG